MATITLYAASVPIFKQMLTGLSGVLQKAQDFCDAKKIDANALLSARLYPDMFPLVRQVQIATDHAKGATARLAGLEVPAYPDSEATIADLRGRIAKTLEFIGGVPESQIAGSEEREVVLQMRAGPVTMKGLAYLQTNALPNFFFHVTTAYDILRHNGVEIGKRDYLGPR